MAHHLSKTYDSEFYSSILILLSLVQYINIIISLKTVQADSSGHAV